MIASTALAPQRARAAAAMATLVPRPPSLANHRAPTLISAAARGGAQAAASAPPPPSLLDRLAGLFSPPSASSRSAANSKNLRPTPAAVAAAKRVVELAEASEGGTKISPEARAELLELAIRLRDDEAPRCSGSRAAAKQAVTGTWRQLFSTEKETLFIFTTIAPLFGVRGEDAFQVIDAEAGRLQNVITFSNGAAFVVESTLRVEDPDEEEEEEEEAAGPLPLRCSFKFTGAALKLPSGKTINLPPAGKGWFDTTYVDAGARVAFDVRGDTLVVERDGPVRWY